MGYDETTIRRLLHEQAERRRMKTSAGPVRYELTAGDALDLAKERLIYAIVAEFMTGQAASIAGLDDDLLAAFGLTGRDRARRRQPR